MRLQSFLITILGLISAASALADADCPGATPSTNFAEYAAKAESPVANLKVGSKLILHEDLLGIPLPAEDSNEKRSRIFVGRNPGPWFGRAGKINYQFMLSALSVGMTTKPSDPRRADVKEFNAQLEKLVPCFFNPGMQPFEKPRAHPNFKQFMKSDCVKDAATAVATFERKIKPAFMFEYLASKSDYPRKSFDEFTDFAKTYLGPSEFSRNPYCAVVLIPGTVRPGAGPKKLPFTNGRKITEIAAIDPLATGKYLLRMKPTSAPVESIVCFNVNTINEVYSLFGTSLDCASVERNPPSRSISDVNSKAVLPPAVDSTLGKPRKIAVPGK